MSSNFWAEKTVLVTGGASFIGSHLVDKLVSLGAVVSVADDLSTGKIDNLQKEAEISIISLLINSSSFQNSLIKRKWESLPTFTNAN